MVKYVLGVIQPKMKSCTGSFGGQTTERRPSLKGIRYYKGKWNMKITISIPDKVYRKLEEDRGIVPRSTYIQDLISYNGVYNYRSREENLPTKTKQVLQSVQIRALESKEDIREKIIGEIGRALELGERENWERVKKLVRESGYEWSITTRELRKDGILIKRFPL